MIPRVLLGYLLALPAIGLMVLNEVERTRTSVIVTMSSSQPGILQLFYDSGRGFNEPQSSHVQLQPSEGSREYRLELPPGQYRSLRIDPGIVPDRYTLQRVAIRLGGTATDVIIPFDELVPANDVRVAERSASRLVVDGVGYDPHLLYTPPAALSVPSQGIRVAAWLEGGACWLGMMVFVWLGERGLMRLTPAIRRASLSIAVRTAARPVRAISVVAVLASGVATYPIWYEGRSFVSPNNGGAPMLYSEPPFVPGSSDVYREDTRGSDVWAAMLEFVPYSRVQREALRQGELPLWNRYNGAGRPLWGQGMTLLLDPLHWLTLVTPNPAFGWDLKFLAHRLVFALGVGLAAFGATGALLPSVIVTASSPFLGIYSYWLSHPGTFALTYAPWALLAWFRLARAETWRARAQAAILISVTMSLILVASPPKQAVATLAGIGLAGGLAILLASRDWGQRARSLAAAGVASLIMSFLTAPHWMTFLDTLRVSVTEYDVPRVEFADERAAIALFLTPLNPGQVAPGLHLLALVLGLATVTAPRYLWNHPELLAALASSLTLLAAAFGFVPAGAIVHIPFIKNIVHVNDIFVAAAIPLFLVSGAAGASVLLSAGRIRAAMVAALIVAAGCWLIRRGVEFSAGSAFQPWAVAFLVVPAAGLPSCIAGWKSRRTAVLSLVAACAVLVSPGGLHLESGSPDLDALLIQPRHRVQLDLDSPAVDAVRRASANPTRSVGLDTILMPGSQALYQLEGIGGADALEVPAYRELLDAAGVRRWSWITSVASPDVGRLSSLLDVLNVGFILARPGTRMSGLDHVPIPGGDRLHLFRRTTRWPRAFFVDRLTTYSDPAHLVQKAGRWAVPFAAIESQGEADRRPAPPDTIVVHADSYRLTANTTTFRVRSPKPGVAVLSEAYLPGHFLATLNGQRVPYFRVNHAFKAVRIPAGGDWHVTFEYRPPRWDLSLWMAAAGVSSIAVGLAAVQRTHTVSTQADRPV